MPRVKEIFVFISIKENLFLIANPRYFLIPFLQEMVVFCHEYYFKRN